jgi:hypothetical protein
MNTNTLDKILDIEPEVVESEALVPTTTGEIVPNSNTHNTRVHVEPVSEQEVEDDVQIARRNLREMIVTTRDALDAAVILAKAGDAPRAYEVVGKMLENVVNANKELVDLHRRKKDALQQGNTAQPLIPTDTSGNSINIDKAVFIGRSSDLLREIKQIQKAEKAQAALEAK